MDRKRVDIDLRIGAYPWQSSVTVDGKAMYVKRIRIDTAIDDEFTIVELEVYPSLDTPTVLHLKGKLLLDERREG